jgi:hypothetical protein
MLSEILTLVEGQFWLLSCRKHYLEHVDSHALVLADEYVGLLIDMPAMSK